MEYNIFTTLVGTIGATIILVIFVLNQANKLDNKSIKYDFFNLVGSVLLILYAFLLNSIPFLILNSIWALVSFKDVIFYIKKKNE